MEIRVTIYFISIIYLLSGFHITILLHIHLHYPHRSFKHDNS